MFYVLCKTTSTIRDICPVVTRNGRVQTDSLAGMSRLFKSSIVGNRLAVGSVYADTRGSIGGNGYENLRRIFYILALYGDVPTAFLSIFFGVLKVCG